MSRNDISRRNVLKLASLAGSVGAVGFVEGQETENRLRLVEVARSYELPEAHSYHRFHVDSPLPYHVDENRGNLVVTDEGHSEFAEFHRSDVGINAGKFTTDAVGSFGDSERKVLVTDHASHARSAMLVRLDEAFTPESLNVRVNTERTTVSVGEQVVKVASGSSKRLRLKTRSVSAATIHVSTEKVQDERIPEGQRGLKTQYGSVTVDATPVVSIRDYGTLDVQMP